MTSNTITDETKWDLVNAEVTLDGKRAKISGAKSKFATVWQFDNSAISAQWSWEAVARVVANGGKFKT